jgi:hypothetical protein
MDPLVKIISVKDTPGFDPNTLQQLRDKSVTFMVGTHGPFYLNYHAGEYNQARVEQDIQAEVNTLRGLGALPASTGY